MNPVTAIAFILAAASLLFQTHAHPAAIKAGKFLALIITLFGAMRLAGYLGSWNVRIDQILFSKKLAGNVMAPNTALGFLSAGLSLILMEAKSKVIQYLQQIFALVVFLISLLAFIGYGYGVQPFYKVSVHIPMALNTALAFSLLSIGILNARPQQGFMEVLISNTAGGFLARQLLPAVIIVPLLLGELRLLGERAGLYGTEFGVSLLVVSSIVIFLFLVWWTALIINRMDIARNQAEEVRKKAEEALQKINAELEKRVEERTAELKQAQHQLVQQERLRALGEMASGIAHDFNNALAPILGYSELMIDAPDILRDTAKILEHLKTINTSARDAAKVVSRLREFYRPREKNEVFHSIELNPLVQQVITLTQPKWKAQAMAQGIDICIQTDLQKIPLIEGSEPELREALTNLIFNAVDAMPKGGTIHISTSDQNGFVILKIMDTGTGMTEEVRQRCLEPFFSTKGDKGTGLGLSMVYGIIQRHSGTLDIESEIGKGTTFIMRLLISKGSKKEIFENPSPVYSHSLRILLVEDEMTVRDVMSEYLKRDGHSIETAKNGVEGLSKFYAGHFDLVITDRAMPEINGERLAIKIKKSAPQKPIILLSGTADLLNAGQLPEGIDLVLGKPVTLDELRSAILKVLPRTI